MTDSHDGVIRRDFKNSRVFQKSVGVTGLLVLATLMSGCWEEVTEHSPGMYSGKSDPLVASADATSSRAEALQKRFDLVQRDR